MRCFYAGIFLILKGASNVIFIMRPSNASPIESIMFGS